MSATKDAALPTCAMPPLRSWFSARGLPCRLATLGRLALAARSGSRKRTAAIAFYSWDDDENAYLPFALNVLTLRVAQISDVTAFVTRATELPEREVYACWPEQPADPQRFAAVSGVSACRTAWTDRRGRCGGSLRSRASRLAAMNSGTRGGLSWQRPWRQWEQR